MNKTHNTALSSNAKTLRRNLTKEARHLWYDFLKQLPVTVHRQKVIGNYIVDFYIASAKLVIELDGSQHYEPQGLHSDHVRDVYLKSLGLTVLRYSNADVNQRFQSVCQDILCKVSMSEHKPSPRGEGAPQGRMWCSREAALRCYEFAETCLSTQQRSAHLISQ